MAYMRKKKGVVSSIPTGQSALNSVKLTLWFENATKLSKAFKRTAGDRSPPMLFICHACNALTRDQA